MKVLVPHERRTLWLAESQGDRISFVWTWHAALAHVLFGFEQKFSFACEFVTAADQISLKRIAVRQTEAARLQSFFEVAPHFSAAIGRAASGITFFIKGSGLYRFTAEIDRVDNSAVRTGLIKPIMDTDTKPADIDVHLGGLFFSNYFLHPARHLHSVQTLAALDLCYAATLAEGNRRAIPAHSCRINPHNHRAIGLDVFLPSRLENQIGRNETVKRRANIRLARREGIFLPEVFGRTKLIDLCPAPGDLLRI